MNLSFEEWYHPRMGMMFAAEPIPLELDESQVLRVAGTRVPIDTVVAMFEQGETAEEIAQSFPVLQLDDIYAVLTYYLRHRDEVRAYLERRGKEAAEVRQRVEAHPSQSDLRRRLIAKKASSAA